MCLHAKWMMVVVVVVAVGEAVVALCLLRHVTDPP